MVTDNLAHDNTYHAPEIDRSRRDQYGDKCRGHYNNDRNYCKMENNRSSRKHRMRARMDKYTDKKYYFSESSSSSKYSISPQKWEINAKPNSNIKTQQRYPHFSLRQVSGFIGQNLQFYQLTYEQFIARELTTISTCTNAEEIEGRTEVLQRVTLWKLRANVMWAQVCNAYAHIIRKIENKEIMWRANWDYFA